MWQEINCADGLDHKDELSELVLHYVDQIIDKQSQYESATDLIYWRDLETPQQPKYTIHSLLASVKKIMEACKFRNPGITFEVVEADLKSKARWFLNILSVYSSNWERLRDAQCVFVAYMAYLHDYGLEVPVVNLVSIQ